MRTVSENDVIRMAGRVAELTRQAGLWDEETFALELDIGSEYYGRAFRLNSLRRGSSGHYRPALNLDFLGMTRRQAFGKLETVQQVVARMMDDEADWELVSKVGDRAEEIGHVGWRLWCERPTWADDFGGFADWVERSANEASAA